MRFGAERSLLTIALAAAVLAARAPAQEAGADGPALLAASGCAACHGSEGRGTAVAPPIVGPALSADAFGSAVRNPRGAMPAYGAELLPDEMLVRLHDYTASQDAVAMPAGRVEAGGALFERDGCYSCHSNQGQGGTQGPRLAPDPIRWGRFVWYVRQPSGQMPPYSTAVLSDQDLADIYTFLAARPRPPDEIPLLAQ